MNKKPLIEQDLILTQHEYKEFHDDFDLLQNIWEANIEEFETVRQIHGIRSTQIMSILALNIIKKRTL